MLLIEGYIIDWKVILIDGYIINWNVWNVLEDKILIKYSS